MTLPSHWRLPEFALRWNIINRFLVMLKSLRNHRAVIFFRQPQAKRVMWLLLAAWVITLIGYLLQLQNHGNKLVASLFVSCMGYVLFFSIVGALLAIISSVTAALESYEDRVNILFQGRRGSQVDYAKSVIAQLGNYSEKTSILVEVHDDDG